ncbi:MAG: holdfast anchoring protein HfaA [Pseudomonadota bacterium]
MYTLVRTTVKGLALCLAIPAAAGMAGAQEASYLTEFERPYGFGYGEEQRPFDARTRDSAGNRVIVNGLIEGGTGLATGLNTAWGQTENAAGMIGTGTAVGNQLNVITTGNYNTVIIDSTQINNGDQNVVLNGELDLND